MNLEEYKDHLKDLSPEALMELIQDIRRNRENTMSVTRVKAVKKKAEGKNIKAALSALTEDEKKLLIEKFLSK